MVKVVIIGPESTGKSTLSQALSEYYKCDYVPEFAREYIEKINRSYNKSDLLKIAKGQIQLEEEHSSGQQKLLICDTDLIVIKIWSGYKYSSVDPWITRNIQNRTYDYYFLTDIDFPWQEDEQREHPDKREYFFNWFKKELEVYKKPYSIISGDRQTRLNKSIEIIDDLMKRKL